ncbi:c-type cytochrome [Methyloligella sp. 2.7D]|uniref:c-type cytochrome n=1 Tax=unclassified Methyloligella TaxID=2625955 RepID=UPI00157D190B|nr:c-type cytochrome [Methyloligella sp. GL2]QKP76551.1 c-type cytochrome [Methyloligella sp. GL2]
MFNTVFSMRVFALFLFAALIAPLGAGQAFAAQEFKYAIDDSPLDVTLPDDQEETEAVKQFHETGKNLYEGDEAAIAEGKEVYNETCQVCHGAEAEGRMCPSLTDDNYAYPRVAEGDVGMFEVIYGGATGAMRSFKDRVSQDQILKVIAYVRTLQ